MGEHVDQDEFEHYFDAGRERWRHLPSGRTGWVLRGGSDTMGAEAPPAADAPAQPDPAPAEAAADAPTPTPSAPMSAEEQAKLIEKLQKENVRYKERFRPYEQAFDGVPPETARAIGQFTRMLLSGDAEQVKEAAKWMRENLDGLSPVEQQAVQAAADAASEAAGGDDDFDPFDRSAIDKLIEEKAAKLVDQRLKERDERAAAEQSTAELRTQMDAEAESLAKELELPGLGVKGSEENELLWLLAAKGDRSVPWQENLRAAAERVQAFIADRSKQYLQRKTADADAPAAPPGGGAPSGTRKPTSIEEASASALERLAKTADGRPGR